MKNLLRFTILFLLVGFLNSIALSQAIFYIDIGTSGNTTSGNWNNLTDAKTGSIADLVDINGASSGYSVSVTDEFGATNSSGNNYSGTSGFTNSSTNDSFWGCTVTFSGELEPTGAITISGLDPTLKHSFVIFAARSGSGASRETKYTVEGSTTTSGTINPLGNTSDEFVVSDIYPTAGGDIIITAEPGPNNTNSYQFYYIGAVRMDVEVSVTGVDLNQSTKSLNVAETTNLVATVAPANANNKSVSWGSSNPSVASVDQTGKVTALAPGNATITVTTTDGSFTANCLIQIGCQDIEIPSGLTAYKGVGEVNLFWDAVNGANGYTIRYGTTEACSTGSVPVNEGDTDNAVIDGLDNGITYYFMISTIFGDCESDPSNVVSAEPASVITEYFGHQVYVSSVASGKNLGAGFKGIRIFGHPNLQKGFNGYTKPVNFLIDIDAPNIETDHNACLTISYDDENLPEGLNLATLDLYRFDEGTNTWTKMEGTYNTEEKSVTLCDIDEFSQWTLAGSAPESVPLKNWGILLVLILIIGGIVLKIFR